MNTVQSNSMIYDQFFTKDRSQSMRNTGSLLSRIQSPRLRKSKFLFNTDEPIVEDSIEDENIFRGYNSEVVNTGSRIASQRTKFLELCYDLEKQYTRKIKRSIKRSESKSPNKDLLNILQCIQNLSKSFFLSKLLKIYAVEKEDIYYYAIKRNIKDDCWETFLHGVYAEPQNWVSVFS